jgi:hypothetical protein
VIHVAPDNGQVISQVKIRLAFMPSVFRATPSEPVARTTLFVIRKVMVDQTLLTACGHKYVH